MRLILLSGFLGAGKTTMMLAAAGALGRSGTTVAVITNDQGDDLVDTATAATVTDATVQEITGGCFCCRYDEFADVLLEVAASGAEVVFAEAVGSCTDLAATVVAPLQKLQPDLVEVGPLTTVVDVDRLRAIGAADDDLGYLFDRQLAEADLVVVNKIDRLDEAAAATAVTAIAGRCPAATVRAASALTGTGLPALLRDWGAGGAAVGPVASGRAVSVDYQRYGAAEAALGWLNQTWRLTSDRPFDTGSWCRGVLERLRAELGPAILLGHAKVAVRTTNGLTKASLVSTVDDPVVDFAGTPVAEATAMLNVRAAMPPAALELAVAAAVLDASAGVVTAVAGAARAFAPRFPRPVHRMGSS